MKRINKFWPLISLIGCYFLFCSNSFFRKGLTTFVEMTHQSDLIVLGTISKTDSNVYHLLVECQLKGDDHVRELDVEEYKPWFCDVKRYDYVEGQHFLLFLNRFEKGVWHTIAGSTGERMLSRDNKIKWLNNNYGLDTVMQCIQPILDCYQLSGRQCYYPICDLLTMDSIMQSNPFFAYIMELQDNANIYFGYKELEIEDRMRQHLEDLQKKQ
ncbi:MAG: hypothetical protein IPM82_00395 [Saprospiraceae bacterium]|nr:hypothetical protein [Saprospiraceae bacterium]